MAARNRVGLSESTRLRIKTTMLVKRLQDHADGNCELSQTQLRAIEILLRKTLPDLSAVAHSGEVSQTQFVVMGVPEATTTDEWAKNSAQTIQ